MTQDQLEAAFWDWYGDSHSRQIGESSYIWGYLREYHGFPFVESYREDENYLLGQKDALGDLSLEENGYSKA